MRQVSVLLLSLLFFSACKKEVTEVQQVNQAFSAIYSLAPSGWSTNDGSHSYAQTVSVPELDDIIQQNGGVLVYLSFDNGANYEAIPEVFDGITYGAVHSTGSVTIDLYDVNGGTITAPGGTILAKIVLIDAAQLGP